MTRSEFIKKIEYGDDIMFDVVGRHFTILTWPDEGIFIGEQYTEDGEYFQDAASLVDNFKINDIPLSGLLHDVKITDYTLVRPM